MKIVLFMRQVILVPSFVNYKNATVACHITEFATMYKCTHIAAVKLENYGCSEILRKFTWCVLDKIERWQDIINPKRSKFFHFRADRFLEGGQPILKDLSSPEIVSSPLNSFDAKFQRTFVVCFFSTNYRFERSFICKVERLNTKQRRSRWDGSLWAVSSGSMLFANLLLLPVTMKELKSQTIELVRLEFEMSLDYRQTISKL